MIISEEYEMSFGYTEAEKRQILADISNKEGYIVELEKLKAEAKKEKDTQSYNSYETEIKRLRNQINGLKAYLR